MGRIIPIELWRREFSHYTLETFRKDLMAGLTVGAVALPLALAFGVASGATAAAGLVTAILGGLIIGALSGAPYQISGPTGAMSAVLILLSQRYGLEGVWVAGVLAGTLILAVGLVRLGRFVAFIPTSVITGFTSGIAVIIFVGQMDAFLGAHTADADTAALKLLGYFQGGFAVQWQTVVVGALVVACMLLVPKRLSQLVPGSLLGILLATLANALFQWPADVIGDIPRTLLLDERLHFEVIDWNNLTHLIAPAVSIAALGAVESLLCGAVGSKMTGIRLHANQELVAQGVGNVLIPFFGGVPATAAIARTSVGIKSGGQTRLVTIIHALVLLASVLVLAPVIGRVPLAALAGVLMVTAVRMNDWHAIRFIFRYRFKTGMLTFALTLLATVTLDLTQAILIGVLVSAAIFINKVANLTVTKSGVDARKLRAEGMEIVRDCPHIQVAYLTGPLFFASTNTFNETFSPGETPQVLILSMRAVPLIDLSGVEALADLHKQMSQDGKSLLLSGVHPEVMRMIQRAGLDVAVGPENFFWGAEEAILSADHRKLCGVCSRKA